MKLSTESMIRPMPMPMPHPFPGLDKAPEAADRAAHVALDGNGDDHIDRAEARRAGWSKGRFAAMDANGDGKVSRDEFVRGRQLEREFNAKDANGDGKLNRQEFSGFKHFMGALPSVARDCFNCLPSPIKDMFRAADADGDGAVSREEYVASKHKPATPRLPIDIRPMLMKAE